jgi:argininosuccinate synthase
MFRFAHSADVPAHIELAFEAGVPVAVNGITMSLPELNESLATIAADHGIGELPAERTVAASPAAVVLDQARAALAAWSAHPDSGIVRIKLHQGEHVVESVSPAALAHHS